MAAEPKHRPVVTAARGQAESPHLPLDGNRFVADRPIIELLGVTKVFPTSDGGYPALSGLDLRVRRGSFTAIVGPTGSGKSTVLDLIAGRTAPTAGTVTIDGTVLRGLNSRTGYLFQQDTLLPWATVQANVELPLRVRGVPRRERRERARDWLARVGLSGFEDRYPRQLSGGMRKRVALAQNWIREPQLLLMDEPFAALDAQMRAMMHLELLALWAGSAMTVVFVTHDLDEAIALADEVVLLSAGPESSFRGRFPVDLARPRALPEIRTDPAFAAIHREIWRTLRLEVLKSYGRR
ncbi:ABC transporter ATP-binding protein [Nocardia inohanensis]|uniref:ABC transporter ATP-binding protein n=1 Tax=Nocardia inohanensis TaxID=209246 RepID=UPI0009FE31B2|nr:ABC transporter ATP-binding protein [Nocardia inohanensis]